MFIIEQDKQYIVFPPNMTEVLGISWDNFVSNLRHADTSPLLDDNARRHYASTGQSISNECRKAIPSAAVEGGGILTVPRVEGLSSIPRSMIRVFGTETDGFVQRIALGRMGNSISLPISYVEPSEDPLARELFPRRARFIARAFSVEHVELPDGEIRFLVLTNKTGLAESQISLLNDITSPLGLAFEHLESAGEVECRSLLERWQLVLDAKSVTALRTSTSGPGIGLPAAVCLYLSLWLAQTLKSKLSMTVVLGAIAGKPNYIKAAAKRFKY